VSPIEHLVDAFPEDIRFIYRHFPLNNHPDSANQIIVRAAEAAGEQGRFFEYHDYLYERQSELRSIQDKDALRDKLAEYAVELGLDQTRFEAGRDSPETVARVAGFYEHAATLGLRGTPSFFLNGGQFDPAALSEPIDRWAAYIESEKAIRELPSYEEPPMTIDPDGTYRATVETEKGTIVIELLPGSAPRTVNSFIYLSREGWFDGATFHRVIEGFVAQTGDPSGTGRGGPGYVTPDEIDPELKHEGPGWVAMANVGPDTNGSQWYITLAAQPDLDGRYTIFGQVIEGMDVVQSLTLRNPAANADLPPGDRILSVAIEER
jgi:cyclophilin family peptidyl-prolyl cis-trans isomerase